MGTTETLHPQNTSKTSEAFPKGSLSDICCWKADWAAPLCWSKGDALQPLRKGIFVTWRPCTSRNTSCDQSNWHVLETGIRTQNNNNKSPAAVSTSYVWIAQVINNILLLPLHKTAVSVLDDWMWLPPPSYQRALCFQTHTSCIPVQLLHVPKYIC